MNRYKINIEYDGSNLVGWQKQKNGLSIQEIIEKSLFRLTGKKTINDLDIINLQMLGLQVNGVNAIAQLELAV